MPGPQHKYAVKHDLVEPKSAFLTVMAKTTGRDRSLDGKLIKPKKKKEIVGPATYRPEAGYHRLSSMPRAPAAQFHGLPGGTDRSNVPHAEKLAVKTHRWSDIVEQRAKSGPPGVGRYTNLAKSYDFIASLPPSVKIKRH